MFRAILWTQWKWLRLIIFVGGVALFSMPIVMLWNFSDPGMDRWRVTSLLHVMQAGSVLYGMIAAFAGLVMAAGSWSYDMKGKHVYALSLPVPRWHYVLLRFGAGALLLLIPAGMLYIGSLAATSTAVIPLGLHAYPFALAIRFLLASFLAYAIVFALTALPSRTVITACGALAALLLLDAFSHATPAPLNITEALIAVFVKGLGFMDIFAARWMLIDV